MKLVSEARNMFVLHTVPFNWGLGKKALLTNLTKGRKNKRLCQPIKSSATNSLMTLSFYYKCQKLYIFEILNVR